MTDFEVWSVFWFLCVMCIATLPVSEGVWSMCNTMQKGRYGGRTGVDGYWPEHQACPLQTRGIDTFSCWRCQIARHSLGSAQNCWGPTGLQRSSCTLGAKESHRWWQSSLYGTVWAFLVCIWHVTLIKESSFGAETWLITQNLKPEKGCVIDKLSSPSSKENGSTGISKDDNGDTVCWLLLWCT